MRSSPRNLSRRDFLRVAGAATAGVVLASCTPATSSVPPAAPATASRSGSKGPVRLVYQDWRTPWFPAMALEMLDKFHEQQPNIRVFYTPDPPSVEEPMLAEMEADTAPDVFAGCCSFFPVFANQGHCLDLREYVAGDLNQATIDDWSQAQYKAFFTEDGLQFALPKYHGGLALYYNRDMFDQAGLAYPTDGWTHDEYLEAMKKLTVREGDKVTRWGSMLDVSWDRLQMHINGWGGHFVDPEDRKKCRMAETPSLEAHEWLRARMWDDKVMATSLDVEKLETREAFINEKIAMVEDGSWALKDILTKSRFRVGVTTFPAGPAKRVTLATTDGWGIYARTQHPEAAWELLKFLVSQDYGRAMAKTSFLQPARASVVPDWIRYIKEQYPKETADMELSAFADGHIKGYSVTNEVFTNMLNVTSTARETWDRILTLGQAPVSELSGLCAKLESIQQQSSSLPQDCGCQVKG